MTSISPSALDRHVMLDLEGFAHSWPKTLSIDGLGVLVCCSDEQHGVSRAAELCMDLRPFNIDPFDGRLCCTE